MVKTAKTKKAAPVSKPPAKERYFEARGGRKTAVARARLYTKRSGFTVNDKDYKEYFKMLVDQTAVMAPLKLLKQENLGVSIRVSGSGIHAQAEAVRQAVAQALVKFNETFKKRLRRAGFLTRDSRMVERKKYGLKKARRAPQWAKR